MEYILLILGFVVLYGLTIVLIRSKHRDKIVELDSKIIIAEVDAFKWKNAYDKLNLQKTKMDSSKKNLNSLILLTDRTRDVFSVSSEQLKNSIHKIESSTNEAIKLLSRISEEIDTTVFASHSIIQTIEERLLLGVEKSKNSETATIKNKIADIKNKYEVLIKDILSELTMILARKSEDISRMDAIEKRIMNIYHFSSDITAIARTTQILALNAEIESARAGEAGKTFAVIAEQVNQLAQNVQGSAEKITVELKETTNFINQNSEYIKEVIGIETIFLNSTITILRDVFLSVIQSLIELSLKIEEIMELSEKIKKQLVPIVVDLQFEDITKQTNEHIIQMIDSMVKQIDNVNIESMVEDKELFKKQKEELKDMIKDMSTMSQERKIASNVIDFNMKFEQMKDKVKTDHSGEVEFF